MSEARPIQPQFALHTILYICDSDERRLSAKEMLSQSELIVATAKSGPDGLQLRDGVQADLVVLDSDDRNGDLETCRALRRAPTDADLPIVVTAAADDLTFINKALEAGATDFVVAPIDFHLLSCRIRYLLRAAQVRIDLRATHEQLATAQHIAKLGHWRWTTANDRVRLSAEAARILEIEAPVTLGRETGTEETTSPDSIEVDWEDFLDRFHDLDRHRVRRTLSEVEPGRPTVRLEHRLAWGDTEVCQEAQATGGPNQALTVTGTIQDISDRKRAERRIIRLAYNDELTKLPNRTFFIDTLNAMLEGLQPTDQLAVMGVHLTGLYRLIDTFGHDAGDQLIRVVAERLLQVPDDTESITPEETLSFDEGFGSGGTLLARVAQEGFMYLFRSVLSADDAWRRAARVHRVLSEPIDIAGHPVVPSVCVGLALYPEHGSSSSALLKSVETAQHRATEMGAGQTLMFDESMFAQLRERVTVEVALRQAIEQGLLELHYQPKVAADSGRPVGMEALVRWTDPLLGRVSPGRFIPIAEETGLIIPLSEWVLRTACIETLRLRNNGFENLRVAVNVSAEQFLKPNFIHHVQQTLQETGLPPEGLELEITESLLLRDTEVAIAHLCRLRDLRVRIALDDFGTGYSSLSYLHRFPVDTLKIDRSFIAELTDKPKSASIVRAIILLSHGLDIRVVAEGVETAQQLDALRKMGCEVIQGYYFSPALPSADLENWLREAMFSRSAVGE